MPKHDPADYRNPRRREIPDPFGTRPPHFCIGRFYSENPTLGVIVGSFAWHAADYAPDGEIIGWFRCAPGFPDYVFADKFDKCGETYETLIDERRPDPPAGPTRQF